MAATAGRIVVTRRLPASVLDLIRKARPAAVLAYHDSDEPLPSAALREMVARDGGANAIVCLLSDKIDAELIAAAKGSLKVVATMSVGYSHIDVAAARAAGVHVGYTPGVLTETTADLVLALTLATARRLPEAEKAVRTGRLPCVTTLRCPGRQAHVAAWPRLAPPSLPALTNC
jgi:lactate dehydrogenase-like 2-hydroxyacid dehydrogenase